MIPKFDPEAFAQSINRRTFLTRSAYGLGGLALACLLDPKLIGSARASRDTFCSTCHGAGRQHSRSAMKRMVAGQDLYRVMQDKYGVLVMAHTRDGVAEEMPEAYKDASVVVDVMERAGISDKVARLRPIGCIKG